MTETIAVRVKQGIPGEEPRVREYRVPRAECFTVLDALDYVWRKLEPTLAFRHECRSGNCGVCAVSIDGRRCLACTTVLVDGQEVGPVEKLPLVRDLVVEVPWEL